MAAINAGQEEAEEFIKFPDAGFFPDVGRATPLPVADLLKETGYNVEEDQPLLEMGK